jgi:predicted N-formylglutamate amidohydrolase
MPATSEVHVIPGNKDLTQTQRTDRSQRFYVPFRDRLASTLEQRADPIVVTVHSFTPIYRGHARTVEFGILHDSDTRLADAMLLTAAHHTSREVRRNDPYGPEDGVTHTLKEHALPQGRPNVMLEIRNDLIRTPEQQEEVADCLCKWLHEAVETMQGALCSR